MRIATGAERPRNDMVFTRGAVRRRDTWVPPYNRFCRAGPVCPAGSAVRNRRADRGVGPYGGLQGVQWAGDRKGRPYEVLR